MKLKPKKHLGIIFLLAFCLAIIFILFVKKTQNSSIVISSSQNKVEFTFKLSGYDRQKFTKFLEKLYLPQSIQDGISLELDSTSSAAVAYVTPLNINVKTSASTVNLSTKIARQFTSGMSKVEVANIPKNSNLAIFAPTLVHLATNMLPAQLSDWTRENFKSTRGQIFIVFGKNADFALLTPETQASLSSVKDLQMSENSLDFYKEETVGDTTYYLVNFENEGQDLNLALFKYRNWQVLTSSRQSAITITNVLSGKEDDMQFPKNDDLQNAVFVLLYSNGNENQISENFQKAIGPRLKLISNAKPNVFDSLQKVEEARFSLMANQFSGLIKFK